ncbi:bifunctional alpha/beta hydrolase/OsmC family protein [Azospirillum sp. B4]|uniref:bifunctional alpha/beta hydrolase/OsmC family protein n=1 Tax=Azospirillum sp. B4 TaxID=95605 RepID=UPI00034865A4|nr:bifunctional alpha/beta hydrolase/OsmC family protein [Azospirillum sp. B4]
MTSQPFDFDSAKGYRLSGRIEPPEGAPHRWALFAHCFTCGKDSRATVRLARALALQGIGVLRFDFAGLGRSGGRFADGGFAADVDDLVAAGAAMARAGMAPSLLLGHSFGGAAVLAAAGDMPTVKAVATIAAPADVDHILRTLGPDAVARIEAEGEAEVNLAGRPFIVRKSFIDDARQQDLATRIAHLRRPLLVLHAPGDTTVGIDNASRIFLAARHPKSFVSLDDADHLLTRPADADYAATVIAAWAGRYLGQPAAAPDPHGAAEGVLAVETGRGKYQLAMRSGAHHFIADEPVAVGGLDSGLGPYDLVSAGLAACTTMTMRMYAERKGLPLERAQTRVVHTKRADLLPADLFTRTITLDGPLDAEQRAKLLSIADRCPVDLTLTRGAEVLTQLAKDVSDDSA